MHHNLTSRSKEKPKTMDARVVFLWSTLLILLLLLLCFLPTPSLGQSVRCHKDDFTALMKIKAALHNPDYLASWIPNTDCCNWVGVRCEYFSTNHRVNRFIISDADISCQIPSEVGDLPYLYQISFDRLTNLTGNIPSTITKLKNLVIMTFIENKLSGPIPSFLAQLPSLGWLDLSFNQFTRAIPSSLSNNTLLVIRLQHNKLSGKFPESFASNFRNSYVYVDLSHNNLRGRLPRSLRKVDFDSIYLSGNKLKGDASMLFRENGSTNRITLSNNKFAFDLSKVEIPTHLENLEISHKKIFGSIPEGLTGLKLRSLNVSYNRLSGKIPQGGNIQNFDSYNFYHYRGLCDSPLPACK